MQMYSTAGLYYPNHQDHVVANVQRCPKASHDEVQSTPWARLQQVVGLVSVPALPFPGPALLALDFTVTPH